jgi:cytochrome P450
VDVERIKKYGTISGVSDGNRGSLVVAEPEILKDMLIRNISSFMDRRPNFEHPVISKQLVLMSGDEWRQTRTIISPTFTSGKMKAMFPKIKDAVSLLLKQVDNKNGTEFDLKNLFGCLTMDVIAKCAFAVDTNTHEDDKNPFVANARAFFDFPRWRFLLAVMLPRPLRARLGISVFNQSALTFLAGISRSLLEERRKMKRQGIRTNDYTDFLQLLMEAGTQTDDDQKDEEDEQHAILNTGVKGKTLTDDEIIANIILVLVAGYETTASLLTYACYNLACSPECQEKLRKEIDSVDELNYDTVMKLPYLDAVICETLRTYSPVTRVDRQVSNKDGYTFDSHLGKIHMPHGTAVVVPIYAIHHMEQFYPDPYKFDPERFMPENKDKLVPYTYMPFVIGPRNCVGMRFALLEAKLTLATLIKSYKLSKTPNTDIPLDFSRSIILLNPKRVIVRISNRD